MQRDSGKAAMPGHGPCPIVTDDPDIRLPPGWWIVPFSGIGLCLWTSLALYLI